MEGHPVPIGRLLRVARGRNKPVVAVEPPPAVSQPRRLALRVLGPLAWLGMVCTLAAPSRADRPDDETR